jgi:hypothetical protein
MIVLFISLDPTNVASMFQTLSLFPLQNKLGCLSEGKFLGKSNVEWGQVEKI